MQCENGSSSICGQQGPRSACASAQSDQDLHCPLTELLDTTECMKRTKAWMILCACARRSESVHFARARRRFFAWRGRYVTIFIANSVPIFILDDVKYLSGSCLCNCRTISQNYKRR